MREVTTKHNKPHRSYGQKTWNGDKPQKSKVMTSGIQGSINITVNV